MNESGIQQLILVVDDQTPVLEFVQAVLESAGYRVLSAADGREGLSLFRQHSAEIRLVITDKNMPVMNGVEMTRQMKQLRPRLKVLVTSGMEADRFWNSVQDAVPDLFLQKPFSPEELVTASSRLLANDSAPPPQSD